MRPSAPLSPQHQAIPPLAMSQACIVPALIERYLMTMTCDCVPIFPSLVAVTVIVPRSMPVSTPVTLSIGATAGLDVVQRMTRAVSRLSFASRVVARSAVASHASIVSGAAAIDTFATETPGASDFTVIAAAALFPSLDAVIVAFPAATPVTVPLLSTDAMLVFDDDQLTVRPVSALPDASRGVALSFAVCPTTTSTVCGATSTEATLTDGGGFEPGSVVLESEPHATARAKRAATAAERTFSIVGSLPIEVSRCLNARGDYGAALTRQLLRRITRCLQSVRRRRRGEVVERRWRQGSNGK